MHDFSTNQLTQQLRVSVQATAPNLEMNRCSFEVPANREHGHLSTNVALSLYQGLTTEQKQQISSPRVFAEKIVKQLKTVISDVGLSFSHQNKKYPVFDLITVAGPGFINFFFSQECLITSLGRILENPELSVSSEQHPQRKRAIVEFSSPNIAKPFTIGHLRSTVIGAAVANLLEKTGWEVLRDNHLGDWGTQFGKQIYAMKHLGAGDLQTNIALISEASNPVEELVRLYVEFHTVAEKKPEIVDAAREWFRKLEGGDQEARKLWQQCIEWSWAEFSAIYTKLGVGNFYHEFDEGKGLGESFFEDKMEGVVAELREKQLLQSSEGGAQLVFFDDESLPPAMIIKSDGSTLYHTRDLATDKYRKIQYDPDLIINEVGSEQQLYFRQLFEIERLLGWFKPEQRVHIGHGLVRFSDKKMSTRKGNVIWLRDVLDRAYAEVQQIMTEDTTLSDSDVEKIAVGALKWSDLRRSAHHNIVFDWQELMNLQGNSGPYMQYTYVRCRSLLAKATIDIETYDFDILNNIELYSKIELYKKEHDLLLSIKDYFDIVLRAAETYQPHVLCAYLYSLAQEFNAFYAEVPVLHSSVDPVQQKFRLALVRAVSWIIKDGLNILGIEVVEKM